MPRFTALCGRWDLRPRPPAYNPVLYTLSYYHCVSQRYPHVDKSKRYLVFPVIPPAGSQFDPLSLNTRLYFLVFSWTGIMCP